MYATGDLAEHFCRAAVNSLPPEERRFIVQYYLRQPRLFMDNYAVQYGQTMDHVCKVRDRALRMMREQLRAKGIRSMDDL